MHETLRVGALLMVRRVLGAACRDDRLQRRHRRVLVAICDHLNGESGMAFPGWARLAQVTGLGQKTIGPTLSALRRWGYVVDSRRARQPGERAITHYTVRLPKEATAAAGDTAGVAAGDTADVAGGDTADVAAGDTADAAAGDTAGVAAGDTADVAAGDTAATNRETHRATDRETQQPTDRQTQQATYRPTTPNNLSSSSSDVDAAAETAAARVREEADQQQQQRFRRQRPRSGAEWRALLQWLLFDDEGRQTPWDTRMYGKLPGVPGYWVHRKVLDEFGGPAHVGEILAARAIAKPSASRGPAPKMNGYGAH